MKKRVLLCKSIRIVLHLQDLFKNNPYYFYVWKMIRDLKVIYVATCENLIMAIETNLTLFTVELDRVIPGAKGYDSLYRSFKLPSNINNHIINGIREVSSFSETIRGKEYHFQKLVIDHPLKEKSPKDE